MDINYVVIEDDSNIYYSRKKYDTYFTMKHPVLIHEDNSLLKNDYSLSIDLKKENNDQIILITIDKYKLLDFIAKLGGIMKIITIMKMTCFFLVFVFLRENII